MFHVNLPVSIFKEGKSFVAYSPVIDLSSCGKTRAAAERHFGQAVGIFFEELVRLGTLGDVLADLGWTRSKKEWQPPVLVSHKIERMKVAA